MHNIYVPVVAIVVAFAAIFGYQAFSESHIDDDIAARIALEQGPDANIGIDTLKTVQKGYGYCGTYVVEGEVGAPMPFYYSTVDERVALDTQAADFQRYCLD